MSTICDDISQTEQIKSWVSELTGFTPQQVEAVLEVVQNNGNVDMMPGTAQ